MVLTLLDRTTGRADWQTPAVTSSVNIYNSDGALSGQRNVDLGTNTLFFNGALGTFFVNGIGKTYLLGKTNWVFGQGEWIGGATTTNGRVAMATAKTALGTAANGQVLTLMDAPGSVIEYQPPSNLYNNNGTLGGNRNVDGNFRDLSLTNNNVFDVRGRTSVISGSLELDLKTPKIAGGTAAANQVLTLLDATTGRADYAALPAAPAAVNIYNTDGAFTGTRIINMNGKTVYWGGSGGLFQVDAIPQVIFSALTNTIAGTESSISGNAHLRIAAPGGGSIGDVLTYKATGSDVWWQPPTHIYRSNGTLTGNRIVTGGGFDLSFTNNGTLALSAATNTIKSTGGFNLATPTIVAGTAVAGQILTLADAATGRVEYSNAPTSGGSVNIYNANGSLTGNRQVGLAGKDLIFDGAAGASRLISQNINYSLLSATDFILYSPWRLFSTATTNILEGTTQIQLKTPKVRGGTGKPGDVLVLSATDGVVEFQTVITNQALDTSIYNTNGTLSGPRTVQGAGNSLNFLNLSSFDMNAGTLDLISGTRMGFKTPKVNNTTASPGQFLSLLDLQTGAVDFATPNWQNLYTTDGSILGTRQVTITQPANLIFNGQGTITSAATLATVNLQATNIQASASSNLFLSGKANISMSTPKVWLGQAQQGQILTLTDAANGYVEWATPTFPTASAVNIYNTNGSLSGPRVVTLNNQLLTFQGSGNMLHQGLGTWDVDTLTRAKIQTGGAMEIGGQTSLKIRTPKVQSATPPSIGHVLAISGADGTVEFSPLPATPSTIQTEYHADLVLELFSSLYYAKPDPGSISPLYGGDLHNPPPYSRWIFKIKTSPTYNGAGIYMSLSQDSHSQDAVLCRSGLVNNSSNLGITEVKEGYLLETIYMPSYSPAGSNAFVVVNSGWSSAKTSPELQGPTGLIPDDEVLKAGIKFSLAAVVDVLADVASLPLNFKKVETLGRLTVGDGEHAGYYQAAYDPNAPVNEIVRSSVDMARMWRKLIPKP